jgi:FkbM family methyltransferase
MESGAYGEDFSCLLFSFQWEYLTLIGIESRSPLVMKGLEALFAWFNETLGFGRWPLVGHTGRRIALQLLARSQGGIHRRLGGHAEVLISPGFLNLPKRYEHEAMQTAWRLLREGDMGMDIGAHIGLYSLLMGKRVGPTGRVFSFEPASQSFQALGIHIDLNSLSRIVEAHQVLADKQSGVQRFFEDKTRGTNRIGGSVFDGPQTVPVDRPAITIDEFLEQRGGVPTLIKIDVEGYELRVLQGARKTLQASRCRVLCEMHPNLWAELGHDWTDIQAFMNEIDYAFYDLDGKRFLQSPSEGTKIFLLQPTARENGSGRI